MAAVVQYAFIAVVLLVQTQLSLSSKRDARIKAQICRIRCKNGWGGAFCHCNAVHFAGKRGGNSFTSSADFMSNFKDVPASFYNNKDQSRFSKANFEDIVDFLAQGPSSDSGSHDNGVVLGDSYSLLNTQNEVFPTAGVDYYPTDTTIAPTTISQDDYQLGLESTINREINNAIKEKQRTNKHIAAEQLSVSRGLVGVPITSLEDLIQQKDMSIYLMQKLPLILRKDNHVEDIDSSRFVGSENVNSESELFNTITNNMSKKNNLSSLSDNYESLNKSVSRTNNLLSQLKRESHYFALPKSQRFISRLRSVINATN